MFKYVFLVYLFNIQKKNDCQSNVVYAYQFVKNFDFRIM